MNFGDDTNVVRLLFFFIGSIILLTKGIHYFLKNPGYQKNLSRAFILLIIIGLAALGIYRSLAYSKVINLLEETQEILVINAAYNYLENGLSSNYGLPDNSGYKAYEFQQALTDPDYSLQSSETPRIYTHSPPSQYWLGWVLVKICGKDNLGCMRLYSTATGIIGLSFFALMLILSLSPFKSSALFFSVAILPMTTNMMPIFTHTNWGFSLFITQLGYLLYFFKKKTPLRAWNSILLFTLGFIQGWFTFEYFFLICLSPLPLALLYSKPAQKEDKKRLILVTLLLTTGYFSAFFLHFVQNSLFYGSAMDAYKDFFEVGKSRLSAAQGHWKIDRITLTLNYFFVFPRSFYFFIINFPILIGVVLVLIWFKDISFSIQGPVIVKLKWTSDRRHYFVILTALLISLLWMIVMSYNASQHTHLFPRLLFFSYFVCILTVLECTRIENLQGQQE